jgi:ribosomal protein S18 acetylase RimI-like enzyme
LFAARRLTERLKLAKINALEVAIGELSVSVRTAEDTDGPRVLTFLRRAAEESEFLVRCPEEITTTNEQQADVLKRKLTSPHDLFLIAETGSELVAVGLLSGSGLKRFGHEVTLAITVRESHWGKGIGRALMQQLISWADSQGIVRIALEVVETNVRAVALYESLGFVHEGRLLARRRHGDAYLTHLAMARLRLPCSPV